MHFDLQTIDWKHWLVTGQPVDRQKQLRSANAVTVELKESRYMIEARDTPFPRK